jgi:hypothetical protein
VKFQRLRIITGIVAFAGSGGAIGTVAAVYLGHGFYSIDLIVFSIGLGAIPAAIAGLTSHQELLHAESVRQQVRSLPHAFSVPIE